MPHIHDLIDFTIAAYIVHDNKILFIHHKQLNKWLPIGGHIELNEDPEQALFREIEEETGLHQNEITVLTPKPNFESLEQKYLYTPNLLDIHKISDTHRHIGIIYFIHANTSEVKLEKEAHHEIHWLSIKDLSSKKYNLRDDMIYAAQEALRLDKSFKA